LRPPSTPVRLRQGVERIVEERITRQPIEVWHLVGRRQTGNERKRPDVMAAENLEIQERIAQSAGRARRDQPLSFRDLHETVWNAEPTAELGRDGRLDRRSIETGIGPDRRDRVEACADRMAFEEEAAGIVAGAEKAHGAGTSR